jgi:DNA mismatch repair ATPase MutS
VSDFQTRALWREAKQCPQSAHRRPPSDHGALDLAAALAERAVEGGWVRPVVEAGTAFEIAGGRHPTVEAALAAEGHGFVANDCTLATDRIWLVTGPNMAGKSTFLRQNALIAILAQAGFQVPAKSARIGIVDRLFSRVGAADDLATDEVRAPGIDSIIQSNWLRSFGFCS